MLCAACHGELVSEALFCHRCGKRVEKPKPPGPGTYCLRCGDDLPADGRCADCAAFPPPAFPRLPEGMARVGRHDAAALCVAWRWDGKALISGGADGTLVAWSGQILGQQRLFHGHRGPVHAVAWAAEGHRIATGSGFYVAKVWNADGEIQQTFSTCHDRVPAVAFASDNRHVALASRDEPPKLWDASMPRHGTLTLWDPQADSHHTWPAHDQRITSLQFIGDLLLSTSVDGAASLWRRDGESVMRMGHPARCEVRAAIQDGVFTICDDLRLRFWQQGTLRAELPLRSRPLCVAAFHSRAYEVPHVAIGCEDGTVSLATPHDGVQPRAMLGDAVTALAFCAGTGALAAASADGSVWVWEQPQ